MGRLIWSPAPIWGSHDRAGGTRFALAALCRSSFTRQSHQPTTNENEKFNLMKTLLNRLAGSRALLLLGLGLLLPDQPDLRAQPVPHYFSDITALPDHTITLSLGGSVSNLFASFYDLYVIEASPNLTDWLPLATLVRTNAHTNTLAFTDIAWIASPSLKTRRAALAMDACTLSFFNHYLKDQDDHGFEAKNVERFNFINQPPVIELDRPANGTEFPLDSKITFSGRVQDDQSVASLSLLIFIIGMAT